jgi:hypothetical protein
MESGSIVHQANDDQTHSSMMAWRVHEFGPPNVMKFEQVPPGPILALARSLSRLKPSGWVHGTAGLGPKRVLCRNRSPSRWARLSGEIIAVGPGVSDLRVGDQVYGEPWRRSRVLSGQRHKPLSGRDRWPHRWWKAENTCGCSPTPLGCTRGSFHAGTHSASAEERSCLPSEQAERLTRLKGGPFHQRCEGIITFPD